MHRLTCVVLAAAFAAAGAASAAPAGDSGPGPAPRAGDPLRGKAVYSRCAGCHSIDQNRIGPKHRGVVGSKAGAVAGYDYSPALKNSRAIWTEANLDTWLAAPTKFIPGVRMGFSLSSPQDRIDVIAYLATQK